MNPREVTLLPHVLLSRISACEEDDVVGWPRVGSKAGAKRLLRGNPCLAKRKKR